MQIPNRIPRDLDGQRVAVPCGYDEVGDEFHFVGVDADGNLRTRNYVWDTDLLDWVAMTASSGDPGAGDVNVTNWPSVQPVSGPLTDTQLRATAVPVSMSTPSYLIKIDEASSAITYIGEATPGTSDSTAAWRIKRMDTTSGVVIQWAGGGAFSQRWDQRDSLSYS